jgi:hypothetical protein
MESRLARLLLVLTVALALAGTSFTAGGAFGQQRDLGSKADRYPDFFKVLSKDGRESLTARCSPIDASTVSCKFLTVRFVPPQERPGKREVPATLEEALRADPQLAQEAKKDLKRFEREWREGQTAFKQDFCSPNSASRVALETRMREAESGPKRRRYYEQLLAACANKDPAVFAKRMVELMADVERRTCGLWVDLFTLEFKEVGEGQWLYRQETPGRLSKVLKIYELTGDGTLWTLSETRVPTEGAKEKPAQTVWSWRNAEQYELPCEFISHDLIQFPPYFKSP